MKKESEMEEERIFGWVIDEKRREIVVLEACVQVIESRRQGGVEGGCLVLRGVAGN